MTPSDAPRMDALEQMKRRADEIEKAHAAADSYYRVAGDEPVDFVLDDELRLWIAAWEKERAFAQAMVIQGGKLTAMRAEVEKIAAEMEALGECIVWSTELRKAVRGEDTPRE